MEAGDPSSSAQSLPCRPSSLESKAQGSGPQQFFRAPSSDPLPCAMRPSAEKGRKAQCECLSSVLCTVGNPQAALPSSVPRPSESSVQGDLYRAEAVGELLSPGGHDVHDEKLPLLPVVQTANEQMKYRRPAVLWSHLRSALNPGNMPALFGSPGNLWGPSGWRHMTGLCGDRLRCLCELFPSLPDTSTIITD